MSDVPQLPIPPAFLARFLTYRVAQVSERFLRSQVNPSLLQSLRADITQLLLDLVNDGVLPDRQMAEDVKVFVDTADPNRIVCNFSPILLSYLFAQSSPIIFS